MKFEFVLAVQLFGLSSGYLAQYAGKKDPVKEAGYDYCQAGAPSAAKYSPLYPEGELLSVQIFHRHGDRSPIHFMPPKLQVKDTWNCPAEVKTVSFKPLNLNRTLRNRYTDQCGEDMAYCGYNPMDKLKWKGNCYAGQLTQKGIDQFIDIGKHYRDIYVDKLDFLPKNWSEARKHIYVRSTDVQRTQQSATSFLTGWFPFTENDLKENPIRFEVVPGGLDVMTPSKKCPKLKKLEAEFRKSPEYAAHYKETQELRDYFNSFFPQDLKGDNFWTSIWLDTIASRHCHKKAPVCVDDGKNGNKCITEYNIRRVMQAANDEIKLWFGPNSLRNKGLIRTQIGGMLWEIKNNLLKAPATLLGKDPECSVKNYPRLKIYSGHDTTISPLLGGLNADKIHWSPYASTLTLELWNPKKKHSTTKNLDLALRVLYNGKQMGTSWCPKGVCKVRDYLVYLRDKLGFNDNQIPEIFTDKSKKTWDYYDECYEN